MIEYEAKVDGELLEVRAWGYDESLQDVLDHAHAIIEMGIKHGTPRVLLDERELEYRIGTFNTYELARQTAERVPHVVRVALLPGQTGEEDAAFWENVVVNRGLTARVFRTDAEARQWLGEA